MVCVGCGATIAAKAIVCYRCGTPTVNPAATVRGDRPAGRRSVAMPALLVLVALVTIALGTAASVVQHRSASHFALAGAALLALGTTVYLFVRMRR